MKNKKVLYGFLVTGTIFAAILIIFFLINSFFPNGHFESEKTIFDNNYNNSHISDGNLAFDGQKLYLNYNGEDSIFFYGTYKTDDNSSKRIFWYGPSWSSGNSLYSMQVFKNNILLKGYTVENMSVETGIGSAGFGGKIYRFNKDTDSIELFSKLDGSDKNKYLRYETTHDKIYVFSQNSIYESYDGKKVKKIFDNVSDIVITGATNESCYYLSNNSICYISKDGYIKEYSFKTQNVVFSKKLKEAGIDFNKEDGFLYTIAKCKDKIILIDSLNYETIVYNVTDNFKIIFEKDISYYGITYYNANDNFLFLSSEKYGIAKIDVKTGSVNRLLNKGVKDTYIFDDKWIYYFNKVGILNRITQNGKTTEKVFG